MEGQGRQTAGVVQDKGQEDWVVACTAGRGRAGHGEGRAEQGRARQNKAGQDGQGRQKEVPRGIPAKPLCMQAASTWTGSLGCHFKRHTPPPVLTCKAVASISTGSDSALMSCESGMHRPGSQLPPKCLLLQHYPGTGQGV